MSALPEMSKVAASSSPVRVTFLKEAMSLLASTTTALLATTVPAVEPSNKLISAAVEVTPSKMLSSAVVEVTPSKMLSSAAVVVTALPPIRSLSFTTLIVVSPFVKSSSSDASHIK